MLLAMCNKSVMLNGLFILSLYSCDSEAPVDPEFHQVQNTLTMENESIFKTISDQEIRNRYALIPDSTVDGSKYKRIIYEIMQHNACSRKKYQNLWCENSDNCEYDSVSGKLPILVTDKFSYLNQPNNIKNPTPLIISVDPIFLYNVSTKYVFLEHDSGNDYIICYYADKDSVTIEDCGKVWFGYIGTRTLEFDSVVYFVYAHLTKTPHETYQSLNFLSIDKENGNYSFTSHLISNIFHPDLDTLSIIHYNPIINFSEGRVLKMKEFNAPLGSDTIINLIPTKSES